MEEPGARAAPGSPMVYSMTDATPTPKPGSIIMYTTDWCGYCQRLKMQLDRAKIPYEEINIERTTGAAKIVAELNGGNETVPTVIFPDGSAATNPSARDVQKKLSETATSGFGGR